MQFSCEEKWKMNNFLAIVLLLLRTCSCSGGRPDSEHCSSQVFQLHHKKKKIHKYINTKRHKYKRTQTKLSHLWNLLYSRVLAEKVQHGVSQGATRLQSHLSYVSWEMNDIGHVGNYSPYVISYIVFCCCYCCCWHIICQILFHLARFLYHHLRRKGQWWQCLIWFIP